MGNRLNIVFQNYLLMSDEIINSWEKNAQEWLKVIDNKQIKSRQFTNKAIEDILRETPEKKILDVGCGEGWLTRSMTKMGKIAVGIDAIETLLIDARSKGPESFYKMSYEEIITGEKIPEAPYDTAVFNFCIYQNEGLVTLLQKTKKALSEKGKIVIQTLHPYFLFSNGLAYKSQTISDSWKGLSGNFSDGHQWYARTFEDWMSIISTSGMKLVDLKETVDSEKKPISLILMLG